MPPNDSTVQSFEDAEQTARFVARERPAGKPLKVAFISHQHSYWNCFSSIIRAMQAKPEKFDVAALMVPFVGHEQQVIAHIRHPLEELRAQGFPVRTPERYNIHQERPELAFFSTPYTVQREVKYFPNLLLAQGTLSALVPYCTEFMGTEDFLNGYLDWYKFFWRTFASSSMSGKVYTSRGQAPKGNAPALGNPEYDVVLNARPESLQKYQMLKRLANGRKIVLWTPHYKTEAGWATWSTLGERIAKLFLEYSDEIFIVARPHQMLAGFMLMWKPGSKPQNNLEEIAHILYSGSNCWLDIDPLAIESVYAADAVISDMSSILTKAMALNKSVLYTYGKEGSGAGMAEPVLTRYIHNATSVNAIRIFLEMVKNGEQDPLLPLPENVKSAFCGPVDSKAGQRIADYLENYFSPAE